MQTLKILLRNMKRQWAVSAINIVGLVMGITSAILILGYVFYERSYDTYHPFADDVYRVVYDRYRGETLLWKTANSFYPIGIYLEENYPEAVDHFNLMRNHNIEISLTGHDGQKINFFEEKTYLASASILRMLSIPLVAGDSSCLAEPNTVIISDLFAGKYFKGRDPLGQRIKVNNRDEYLITGVYRHLPGNTHIKSDLFFSFATYVSKNPWIVNNWGWDYMHSYIRLKPGTDGWEFAEKAFPQMIADSYADDLAANAARDEYFLQPIKDIHLYSAIEFETEPSGNGAGVKILLGFAIFSLLIAWINYVNLVTARSIERAKEVGIKKVCGSTKLGLIRQFISEAFVFNLICIVISVGLICLLMPFYKQLTGIQDFDALLGARFWAYAFLLMLAGIFLSSLYPAFILSSFREVEVLKGNYKSSRQGIGLRKVLVTFQLFLSLVLLIGTGVIYKQVKYLTTKDIGYNYQSTLVIKAPQTNEETAAYSRKIELLKDDMLRNPDITGLSVVSDIPGNEIGNFYGCYKKGDDPSTVNYHYRMDIDPEYVGLFHARLLAGRDFTETDRVSQDKVMVNIKAMNRIGFTDPKEAVGKMIFTDNGPVKEVEIIAVMDDMNYFSVKAEPMPTVFTLFEGSKNYLVLKYSSTACIRQTIVNAHTCFNGVFPGSAFDFTILEDKVAQTTHQDKIFALIFGLASMLAIIISIIGIMGLIIITINQNLKALGIRKVLGADLHSVYIILWRQFYRQFILASMIAIPVAYYGFTHWVLEKYIYHVSVSPGLLIWPVTVIFIILALVVYIFSKKAFSIKLVHVLKRP